MKNESTFNVCSVCLKDESQLINFSSVDSNNLTFSSKLSFCIPEVEWKEGCICNNCELSLNESFKFKELCLKSRAIFLEQKRSWQSYENLPQKIEKIEVLDSDSQHLEDNFSSNDLKSDDKTKNNPIVEREYKCKFCSYTFKESDLLVNHNKEVHNQDFPYDCFFCNKQFKKQSHLTKHEQSHLNDRKESVLSTGENNVENIFICNDCGESFTKKILLISHIRNSHKHKSFSNNYKETETSKAVSDSSESSVDNNEIIEKSFKPGKSKSIKGSKKKLNQVVLSCSVCNKSIGSYRKLLSHSIQEHGTDPKTLKPFACDICDSKFTNPSHLSTHKLYHAGNRTNICCYCGKGFITRTDRDKHERLHLNIKDVECDICLKKFNTKTHVRTHKLIVHTDPSKWNHVCPYCGKRFPMKSNYDLHVTRHTGEKTSVCHLCNKNFSDKYNLQRHIRSHSNVKLFKCDHCDKEYTRKGVLDVHLTKVHGIGNKKIPVVVKKFFCELCPKAFASKNKLQRHTYSHTGEKPYSCNICDKKFTDKWYHKQHLYSHTLQ